MRCPHCGRAEWAPGMPPEYCKGVFGCCLKGEEKKKSRRVEVVVVVGVGLACAILLISRCAINNNEQWETAVNGRRAGWRGRVQGSGGAMQMNSSSGRSRIFR